MIKLKPLSYVLTQLMICQVSMARDINSEPVRSESNHPQPPNLVVEPAYSPENSPVHPNAAKKVPETAVCASPRPKVQYEPVNTDTPILQVKEGEVERTQSA